MVKKKIPYSNLSEQLSKVLWVVAVCQNHDFRATRGIIATVLDTTVENVSYIISQIKQKNKGFIDSENIGHQVPELINYSSKVQLKNKDKIGYVIDINNNVSTHNAARIALSVENLHAKSVFHNVEELSNNLSENLGISLDFVKKRVDLLLNANYLEINTDKHVIPSQTKRIKSERKYLTLLADKPKPDFISNLILRRSN